MKSNLCASLLMLASLVVPAAAKSASEHQFHNSGQQWTVRFDGRGFLVEPEGALWRWGLDLERYGFIGRERAVAKRAVLTRQQSRVSYAWDGKLEEWFVNDRRGLEHGFTIWERPEGDGEVLRLQLSVRGGLRGKAQGVGSATSFEDASGRQVVHYSGLKVWDADGRILDARMEAAGRHLRLDVNEKGARYPVTIDPIVQQAYIKASNAGSGDSFGAVAFSGNTLVVGAPGESSSATEVGGNQNDDSAPSSGAVYVYVRNGGVWTQQAYIKASNTDAGDLFGAAVSISGDTLVVGAPFEDSGATGVGGPQGNNSAGDAGAAYVFVRSGSTWSQQAYLKASNTNADDQFGNAVSISGETLVVGAHQEDSSATGVGGAEGDNGASDSGAAYVFVRNGTTWSQKAYLKASNAGAGDHFGMSVGISGDTVLVGAPNEDSNATTINGNGNDNSLVDAGAAYVFVRTGSTWSQEAYLKASNTGSGGAEVSFGNSVALSGNTALIGASGEDSIVTNSGAAYVFVRTAGVWSEQALLKAGFPGDGDQFGSGLAIEGDLAAVGAFGEDSSSKTDENPNEGATDAGAVYTFRRISGVWTLENYVKASNAGTLDFFGVAIGLSGGTLAASAPGEDSGATGINHNQADNSAPFSGAVYTWQIPCQIKLVLTPDKLTPANRRLVNVTAKLQIPACVDTPQVKLLSIKSNQADSGLEPGDLPKDIQQAAFGTNDRAFLLRAERQTKFSAGTPAVIANKPRVYTVTYEVRDSANTVRRVSGTVTVPYSN